MRHLTRFGQVTALQICHHIFSYYGVIDKIDLEENAVKKMRHYTPTEPISRLINQIEKWKEFLRAGRQTISDAIIVSKGINHLAQRDTFIENIREWRRQSTELKTRVNCKSFFHRAHREQIRLLTTAGKGCYTAIVQNIHGVMPPPPGDKHESIDYLNTIVQGM